MRKFSFLLIFAVGCSGGPASVAPPEPPVVTVEKPVERELDSYTEFTGFLKAAKEIEVKAQVSGLLTKIDFQDGERLTLDDAGKILFQIDPVPYKAALDAAKAKVETAKASLVKAQTDVKTAEANVVSAKDAYDRAAKAGVAESDENVIKTKSAWDVAKSQLNSAIASVSVQTAESDAAAANLEKANKDFTNCTIRITKSDFTASENSAKDVIVVRLSRTQITQGNLVTAGQTVLCKIFSLNPIYAYFDVDETTSLMYRRMIFDQKTLPDPRSQPLDCWIASKDDVGYPHKGFINYIAPEVNRGTASRELRGVIENPDYRLTPGDSVRVKVSAGQAKKMFTIPEIAVGIRQQQKFVYVIVNGIAEFRPIVVGPVREVNGVRLQVVEKGLTANDMVVVNGLLRVRPGAPVTAKEQVTPVAPK